MYARRGFRVIPILERRHQRDVLGHGEMRKQTRFLNHVAGATAQANRIPIGGALSFDQDLAGRWREQAIDESQRGRLAASGLAEQDYCLARGDAQVQPIDDELAAIDSEINFEELNQRISCCNQSAASLTEKPTTEDTEECG